MSQRTSLPPECRAFLPIGVIANRALPQVSPWLTVSGALAMLATAHATEALVVDGDGTPLGVASADRLALATRGDQVERVMTPVGVSLHESVPISIAASLMSAMSTDRIAVTGDERRAVGLLGFVELNRWIDSERARRT